MGCQMKSFIIYLCIFSLSAVAQRMVQGEITGKAEWSGEILVQGDVIVARNAALYIHPGTKIIIAANFDATKSGKNPERVEIIVMGELIAEGISDGGRIVFTSNATDPQLHDWHGIVFKNSRDISILENCLIEYANKGITCYGSAPIIEGCEIRYNEYAGISCEVRSAPFIRNSTIVGNDFAGINCELAANPIIEKSIISQNTNGIIVFDRSNPDLGRKYPDEGQSAGENFIVNNFENNIYNYSSSNIYAQNNLWSSGDLVEIQPTVFDKQDNPLKGQIIIEPVFDGADLPVAFLAANTIQPDAAESDTGDDSTDDLISTLEEQTSSQPSTPREAKADIQEFEVEENTKNLAAQKDAQPAQANPSKAAKEEKSEPQPVATNSELWVASTAGTSVMATTPNQQSNISLDSKIAETQKTEAPAVGQKSIEPADEKTIKKASETTGPILEFQLDSKRREYVKKAKPKYPDVYQKTGFEGKVLAEIIIGLDGSVEEYRILKSDGDLFTESVRKTIKQLQYKPGTFQGKPVKVKIVEPFFFKLKN